MKAQNTLPALFGQDGEIKIFEVNGELCMTQEDLGKCLGYNDPQHAMDNLYQRNKEELEEWRFSPQAEGKTSGGRPPIFYIEEGIYVAAMLARTEVAKTFRKRVARLLRSLRKQQVDLWKDKYLKFHEDVYEVLKNTCRKKERRRITKEEQDRILELGRQGKTIDEIADILCMPHTSVYNYIKRAGLFRGWSKPCET